MSLRTLLDIVPLPKFNMAVIKPEVELTIERREMAPRFQLLPRLFGHARLEHDTVDIVRDCPTLPDAYRLPKIMMATTETGNGNNN